MKQKKCLGSENMRKNEKIEVWRCNQRDLKINDGINVKIRQSERAIPKKVVSLQRKV